MPSLVAFLSLIDVKMCYITYHWSYFFSLICPETLGFSCDQNNLFLLKINAGLFSFLLDWSGFDLICHISHKYTLLHSLTKQNITHDSHCQHSIVSLACILDVLGTSHLLLPSKPKLLKPNYLNHNTGELLLNCHPQGNG